MSSRRHSTHPSSNTPKPPVTFSSSLTIPKEAAVTGIHSITMQAESLIHPHARFDSSSGSILIGRRCVIHERAQIGLPQSTPGAITLSDYVVVESSAVIEPGGTEIGEGTIIQIGSRIGSGAKIGKNCTITPRSVIAPGETLPDLTVVHSNGMRRIDKRRIYDARKIALVKQLAVAKKMIRSEPDRFR